MADAAAVVASEGFLHFVLCGRRVLIEEGFGAHDDTWGTEAALERRVFDEGLLDRVELAGRWVFESFDGSDALTVAFDSKRHTGENRFAVHNDSAAATRTVVAGDLRSGKSEVLSQSVRQGMCGIDIKAGADTKGVGSAVDD